MFLLIRFFRGLGTPRSTVGRSGSLFFIARSAGSIAATATFARAGTGGGGTTAAQRGGDGIGSAAAGGSGVRV